MNTNTICCAIILIWIRILSHMSFFLQPKNVLKEVIRILHRKMHKKKKKQSTFYFKFMLLWLCKLYFLICSEKILFVLLIEHKEWQNIKTCCDGNWYLSVSNYYLDRLRFLHDLYEIKKKNINLCWMKIYNVLTRKICICAENCNNIKNVTDNS